MKTTILIKKIIAGLAQLAGIPSRIVHERTQTSDVILMYHRILRKSEQAESIQDGMFVDSLTFENHIKILKRYFQVTDLKHISEMHRASRNAFRKKPCCVLTFDDGWADFYTNAYPVLKKHDVPATVFLPTAYMGTDDCFWTDTLPMMLLKRHSGALENNSASQDDASNEYVLKIEAFSGSLKMHIEMAIELLKPLREREIAEIISELSRRWGIGIKPENPVFLSWDEIHEMAASGLIHFGSHTASHKILTTLTDDEIAVELEASKDHLIEKKIVDSDFLPFCYPNGNYTPHIAELVETSGYDLAVTTQKGWNDKRSNPYTLKRIPIHQDMTSTQAMLMCRITGIL